MVRRARPAVPNERSRAARWSAQAGLAGRDRRLCQPQQGRRDARRANHDRRQDSRAALMAAAGVFGALEAAPLAVSMRTELWLYPIVEIVHILGFALLVGSIVVLDLRLLGLSRALPVRTLARHVLPWTL